MEMEDAGRFAPLEVMRTAEMVTDGHPDKFCDQVADAILDEALKEDANARAGIECLVKDHLLIVSGELSTRALLDVEQIAREVWEKDVGYGPGEELTVINHLKRQSLDIAHGGNGKHSTGVDTGGAGDQGVMVGYAVRETTEMLPKEYVLARSLCERLKALRQTHELPWLRPDGKSQVTLLGSKVKSVILAAHHDCNVSTEEVRAVLRQKVIDPVLGDQLEEDSRVVINGTGKFTIGGPKGDAGVVGRKIVVDAYGPRIPVGGGAYSGKDPSKVDRSAAYIARHIAKSVVANQMAHECMVVIAFGIGQRQPEMVRVVTRPVSREAELWVADHFRDLSPAGIVEYLGLHKPKNWSYRDTAAFGHYGRNTFPWEAVVSARIERSAQVV